MERQYLGADVYKTGSGMMIVTVLSNYLFKSIVRFSKSFGGIDFNIKRGSHANSNN